MRNGSRMNGIQPESEGLVSGQDFQAEVTP